jgi:TAG lipase / lysophosphatidylethanolamine acyltransferase
MAPAPHLHTLPLSQIAHVGDLGLYHMGVVKALHETHLLPRVLAGSSVGSIVAAIVGVTPDADLPRLFAHGALDLSAFHRRGIATAGTPLWQTARRRLARLWRHGALMDVSVLEACARDNIGDVTFVVCVCLFIYVCVCV